MQKLDFGCLAVPAQQTEKNGTSGGVAILYNPRLDIGKGLCGMEDLNDQCKNRWVSGTMRLKSVTVTIIALYGITGEENKGRNLAMLGELGAVLEKNGTAVHCGR